MKETGEGQEGLWFQEFYERIQFPIERSLPWILTTSYTVPQLCRVGRGMLAHSCF